jgi:O-antigen/teichoic acid export membrane protein
MAIAESRQVVYWTLLFTGVNVGVKGAYFLVVLLLASILTPDAYAGFGLLYAVQGGMTALATVGLQETTVARLKMHSMGLRRRTLYRRISGLFGVTALLAFLMIFPFVGLIEHSSASLIGIISAVLLGIVTGYGTLQASFQRLDNRLGASLLSSAGVSFFGVIGLMIGGWWARDLTLIFVLGLTGAVIAQSALILIGQVSLGPIPSLKRSLREFSSLGPFLIMGIFGWLSGYGMNIIIDIRFDAFHVATFTFLFTAASMSQMIANSLNMVWTPRFYQLFNEGVMDQAETQNRFSFSLLAITLGVVGGLGVAFLPWVTGLVGGNLSHYGDFRVELAFLMCGYIVCISWWYGQNYYHVAGYGSALLHLSLWSGGVGLVLWVICMMVLGSVGIFIGFALQMTIKAVAMWVVGNNRWRLRPPWLAIMIGCSIIFVGLLFPVP